MAEKDGKNRGRSGNSFFYVVSSSPTEDAGKYG
jgi:hypothetical protein